jgi:hypothetical protein
LIKELRKLQEILALKKDLTIDDYKEFKKVEKLLKTDDDKEFFGWLFEGLYQRLPEIAAQEGNYNFLEE